MKKRDFKSWGFMRIVRLVLAVFVTFQAFETETWWMLVITAILLYQVITNSNCASGACELPKKKSGVE